MFSFSQEEKERFIWILKKSRFIEIEYCAYYNNKEGIIWLRELGEDWPSDTIAAAVLGGHFELARWLRQQGCDWNFQTMYDVVHEGDMKGVEWLKQEGYPYDEPNSAYIEKYLSCARSIIKK